MKEKGIYNLLCAPSYKVYLSGFVEIKIQGYKLFNAVIRP